MIREYQLVATLNNGRKVLLEPNFSTKKCTYRYVTQHELDNETLDVNGKYVWHEVSINSTMENGILHIFCAIEATPIVLKRI